MRRAPARRGYPRREPAYRSSAEPEGRALGKQLLAFKAGFGAVLGSGKQWLPWIAIDDAVSAIHHCLVTGAVRGPVNVVAPEPGPKSRVHEDARPGAWPACIPVAAALRLRALFGELTDEGLLASLRVMPKKLLDTGYRFRHTELADALKSMLGRA